MNKSELIEALTEKGVEFDPNSTNAELKALLESDVVEVEEVAPELDKKAKNFASKKTIDPKGSREVEVKVGQTKKVVNEKELADLQVNKLLVGYDPVTKEAVFWANK